MKYRLLPMLLACLFGSHTFAEEAYDLALDRDWIAGTRCAIQAKATSQTTTRVPSAKETKPAENSVQEVMLKGKITVTEPGRNGSIRKATVVVESCTTTQESETRDVVKPGTVIECELKNNQSQYRIDGEEPDEETAAALELVIVLGSEEGTLTSLYGTEKPAKPGQLFQIDPKLAAKESEFEVDPANVTGELKVGEVFGEAPDRFITVTCDMSYRKMKSAEDPDYTHRTRSSYAFKLPLDVKQPLKQMSVATEFVTTAPLEDSDGFLEIRMIRTLELTLTPLGDN